MGQEIPAGLSRDSSCLLCTLLAELTHAAVLDQGWEGSNVQGGFTHNTGSLGAACQLGGFGPPPLHLSLSLFYFYLFILISLLDYNCFTLLC